MPVCVRAAMVIAVMVAGFGELVAAAAAPELDMDWRDRECAGMRGERACDFSRREAGPRVRTLSWVVTFM